MPDLKPCRLWYSSAIMMSAFKHQPTRHWPRHIQAVGWIILIQLALFCPMACIAHCWWWSMPGHSAGVSQSSTMLVCKLHAEHSDSAPQPTPPLPEGLAAFYPMVLIFLVGWVLAPGLGQRWVQQFALWSTYHPQIITPPPRMSAFS